MLGARGSVISVFLHLSSKQYYVVGAIIISVLQSRKLGLRQMCLRHMAGEYGGWIGGQAVLAPAAEISCEPPGPPLSIQIKPRRNRKLCFYGGHLPSNPCLRIFLCLEVSQLYHCSDLFPERYQWWEEKVDLLGTRQQPLAVRALGYKERGLVQF